MYKSYLGVGAVATAAYLVVPGGASLTMLYGVIGLSCVAAILVGVRVNQPLSAVPWYFIAAGQAAWVVGDVLYDTAGSLGLPAHSPDVAYLAAYPLLGAGLADLIRRRRQERDVAGRIDSVIVTIGFGLLSWVFVADPIVDDATTPLLERVIASAYPAADIVLLALVIRLMTVPGRRSAAFRLLIGAMLLLLVADTFFAANPSTDYEGVLDLLWLAGYVLWGAAALHPTMAQLSTPTHVRSVAFTARRLVALVAAVLIAPILATAQLAFGLHVDTWTVVTAASALSLLVVWRMAQNIEEIRSTARQRDRLRSDLFHEASHDWLTGLANGPAMRQRIGTALRRARLEGRSVGLLVVDLDNFDEVNLQYGHGAGDLVIREVTQRLRSSVREVDEVGRLGGVQFAVLVDPVASDHDVMMLAARLAPTLGRPVPVAGQMISTTASIGAASSMDGGVDPDELLHEATVALRRAKAAGRSRIEVFDQGLRRELGERVEIVDALRAGMRAGELEIHYQPVVAVHTEILDGYEAQLRWNRPGHGVLQANDFMPVAAATDLVCEIDRWVLVTATAELAALTAREPVRFADLTVSVSISGRTLADPDLLTDVRAALDSAGLAPHRLTISVTEMTLVDVPNAVLPLSALRRAGVFVSINDFGSGRTPIGQLGHLPADAIKVDKALVTATDPSAHDLLALLVNAAHACGLVVVAAGVDRPEQLVELRLIDCDSAQGIYSASSEPGTTLVPASSTWSRAPRLRIVPDET